MATTHIGEILAAAEGELREKGEYNREHQVQLYRRVIEVEEARLRSAHEEGAGGRVLARERASVRDALLQHLFNDALRRVPQGTQIPRICLVAIGGYGRAELSPKSDIDMMFLHAATPAGQPVVNEIVSSILYVLWDLGFKLGPCTRSVREAVQQANDDMMSKTSMIQTRFIAGDERLAAEFQKQFYNKCVKAHVAQYIADRVADQLKRHDKLGRTVFLQEPDIKLGLGGLRDYQNLLWMAYFKEGVRTTEELVEKKLLNDAERGQLEKGYDFLLRIRAALHYLNSRPTDTIIVSQQLQLADRLGYGEPDILRRTEAFMRDYYMHAREIYQITELVTARMVLPGAGGTADRKGVWKLLPNGKSARCREEFDGFFAEAGRVYPENRQIFKTDPPRMMRLFLHIQQRGLRLSPELKQLVRRRLKYVDTEFQYAKVNREVFAEILRRKGQVSAILREMHDVDFLGRWMPEFGELTCLVQHEFFHRFTVDEHTLFCVEKLDELVDTEEEALVGLKNLFHQVEDPYVLYLALILHDTGKSANRRAHSDISAINADKVARRLQLNAEQRRSLIFLVDNHEMLAKTAQRRNLDDPQTIDEFAKLVKNRKNLDELMLLTCADGRGVGDPAMWTGWKQSLFWQLYRHTSQYLEDSAAYHEARKIERDSIRAAVRELLPLEFALEVEAHFRSLPDRYFQTREPREIADHILLFRKFLEVRWADSALALAPAVQWVEHPAAGYSEVWVCTWDRRQLLARIAGSLSVCGLNILSADIFTRDDGLVLDIFRVCTTRLAHVADERDKLRVEKYLREALAGEEYDFQPLIEKAFAKTGFHLSQVHDFPRRITISDSHPLYNMVDILTADRLGLLYGILRAITDAGFQIATARVTTEKGAAIDNFYLTDDEGRKVTSKSRIDRLRRALAAATLDPRFEGRDAGPAPR